MGRLDYQPSSFGRPHGRMRNLGYSTWKYSRENMNRVIKLLKTRKKK